MKSLYDFLAEKDTDTFDTVDPKYDFILIVTYVTDTKAYTEFEKFCVNIEKKVLVGTEDNDMVIAYWTDFIKNNGMQFRAFARRVWKINPFSEDFFSGCLRRIHNMMSGKESENIYSEMNKLLEACEQ